MWSTVHHQPTPATATRSAISSIRARAAVKAGDKPLGLRHRQIRGHRVKHARESNRLSGLHTERHDVLNLEVNRLSDADSMPQRVVVELDLRALNADHLTYQGRDPRHRAAELSSENLAEFVGLLIRRLIGLAGAACQRAMSGHADLSATVRATPPNEASRTCS
jgi:hypothetical protein